MAWNVCTILYAQLTRVKRTELLCGGILPRCQFTLRENHSSKGAVAAAAEHTETQHEWTMDITDDAR